MADANGHLGGIIHCDVLVVGAGFGGVYAHYKLRKLGLNVKGFEAGSDLGGVWYWNRYPGARVDSEFPFYTLRIPEVYDTWTWSSRFPDHKELRQHFAHIDKVLDLKKDIQFNARVNSATWDQTEGKWTVKTEAGHIAKCKYLYLATGLLHRRHYPDFPGLKDFEGIVHHSGFWPEDLSVRGKRVALIGAGATAVQITQEVAKEADHLTVFMRRPSYCIAMKQRHITAEEQMHLKSYYPSMLEAGRYHSAAGFPVKRPDESFWDLTPEQRKAHWEESWARGGFNFPLTNYKECAIDEKANLEAYEFWASKVRPRMKNPVKRELMAPKEPPYYFGTKRAPLENDYYEMLDQDHVDIVQMEQTPIKTFNKTGVLMEDGTQRDYDIVILATGFDSFSGSLTQMGFKNKDGVDIKDIWSEEISSYLGMLIHGFPNAFMVYSPQAPTAFSNGPTILECQGDFVCDLIARAEAAGARTVEADKKAQDDWKNLIEYMCSTLLVRFTNSWWNGGNIYGKKTQMLTFPAGIDMYEKMCREKLDKWEGFIIELNKEKQKDHVKDSLTAVQNALPQTPVTVS
ncbi:hypothetical protein, variant [Verruconis gallopava]|nr:hypothetical protein, variant [Verruconis gallopava]KIV99317.1 hypothetical protein, variant [Verruconis gallopava]